MGPADTHPRTTCASASEPARVSVLLVRDYQKGEIEARSGETWWGLFPGSEGDLQLRSTRIRVEPLKNPPGALRVTVADSTMPLFLVRGIPGLQEGPVPTWISRPRSFYPGQHESWGVREGPWADLSAYGIADRPPGPISRAPPPSPRSSGWSPR